MRIVTFYALHASIVFFGVDAGDAFSFACRIRKIGMAAQAKLPAAIDIQLFRIFRMFHRRPVAIFAGDYTMQFFSSNLYDGSMTCTAVFMHLFAPRDPVLRRLILPLHFVGLAVERIHETPFPRSEVVRYIEEAKYQ